MLHTEAAVFGPVLFCHQFIAIEHNLGRCRGQRVRHDVVPKFVEHAYDLGIFFCCVERSRGRSVHENLTRSAEIQSSW